MTKHLLTLKNVLGGRRFRAASRQRSFAPRHDQKNAGLLSSKRLLLLLIAVLFSINTYASHYKGGQITYQSLGGGTYKVSIKSYWRSALPGSVIPTYSGSPILNTNLSTVSLTPLPDGVTVEKVEQQTVTWQQPGLHTISWTSCCRVSGGANFAQNLDMGLFAAVNYDPANPSSSPQFYDLPVFNYASNVPLSFSFNNSDPENHEQQYTLNIPYGVSGNPYASMLASGFSIANNGTVSWTNPQQGVWLVNVKLEEKINGVLTGAYVYRDFMLNIFPTTNHAPAITAIAPQTVLEGQPLQFTVNASDPDRNLVALRASGLPMVMGATFVQNGSSSTPNGTFTWTPPTGAAGTYSLQFVATDNVTSPLSAQITVPVTVVSPAPPCNLSATAAITSVPCGNNGNEGTISVSASGGTTYQYSIDGGLTYQNSNVFSNLAPGTYQVVAQEGSCTSAVETVTIVANPLPVVTLNSFGRFCINGGVVTLAGGQPLGGTYSGPGVSNGVFDPVAAGAGTHTISYTYTNSNGCSNTSTATITVNPLPSITLHNLGSVCVSAPAFSLTQGVPPGGSYFGAGVSNGIFDPAAAGVGTHTVTYVFTDSLGCTISASQDIVVNPLPVVSFGAVASVCNNAAPFALTQGQPAGGTYAGPGVTNGVFSAAAAGAGTHTITYNYVNASGCASSATQTIRVNSLVQADAGADKTVYKGYAPTQCATLTASAAGGAGNYTYLWSNGATTAAISVCPSVTTAYTVTVTDAMGCTSSDQVAVLVVDATCGNKNDKVLVCHNGQEICISANAVKAHLAHGDYLGSCETSKKGNGNIRVQGGIVLQAMPNPFDQNTTVTFTMPEAGNYTLEIYDLKGMLVKRVAEGVAQANEQRSVEVKGTEWPKGIYMARLVTSSEIKVTRLMLVK
ncbi:Ig-like domain-containing protein [Adhaeribacter soli]|uniref:T9SS type A sorting domain-containing protein n=1 Tax=Adhaeribacter soli TaxID=2607655 RepID=A0A5N1IPA3_9BACT|nr:T9SS type A sorting domain-containing protein [Adhaeribacter soli]KAA9331801.1 T9SS type A sorting domain-containing protein [Adhaeribacter soli]